MTHDIQPDLFKNNIIAHAAIGKVFNLPTILTTSSETGWAHLFFFRLLKQLLDLMMMMILGPNGPLPREITAMHPNAPYIKRNGEVNAWDNEDFRKAVKATGKTQIIIAGITTDVSIVNDYPLLCTRCSQDPGVHRLSRPFTHRRRIYSLCQCRRIWSFERTYFQRCEW